MQKLHLVGFTTDQKGLILSARRGTRSGSFQLAVDDKLEEAVEELKARRAEEAAEEVGEEPPRAPRVESALPVREIQDRLRQGRSMQEVAKAAGVEPEWVERFAAPVFAEMAQVVTKVRGTPLERTRLGPSSHAIGDALRQNLAERGVMMSPDEFAAAWTTRQLANGRWAIRFTFRHRNKDQVLRFGLDESRTSVVAADRLSGQLGYVTPPPTANPPAPRSRPATPDADSEHRVPVKRATVTTGFRADSASTRATSWPAKERERANAAMRKAAKKRAAAAERTAARKTREKEAAAERREREAKAAEARKAREQVAAERAKAVASRKKAAAAKKQAADKARLRAAKQASDQARRAEAALVAAERAAAKKAAARSGPPKGTTPATAKTAVPEEAAPRKAVPKKATTKKAAPKKAPVKKATTNKAAARSGRPKATRPAVAKKAARRKAPAKKVSTKKVSTKKAPTTNKAVAKKASTNKAVAKKASTRKAVARKPSRRKAVARKAAANRTPPPQAAPKDAPSERPAAKEASAEQTASSPPLVTAPQAGGAPVEARGATPPDPPPALVVERPGLGRPAARPGEVPGAPPERAEPVSAPAGPMRFVVREELEEGWTSAGPRPQFRPELVEEADGADAPSSTDGRGPAAAPPDNGLAPVQPADRPRRTQPLRAT